MDQRQLASVLFAVVGVFIAASRLPEILIYVAMVAQWNSDNPADPVSQRLVSLMGLTSSLLAVLLGSSLVLLRDRLAGRLFPPGSETLRTNELQAVAFSVLGCYLGVEGLSGILWAGRLNWGAAIQFALGVGLFVGSRGLSRLWSLGRSAGQRSPQ